MKNVNDAGSTGVFIISGAMDANRTISSFSNRAGAGAEYYLTALGRNNVTVNHLGQHVTASGTSLSTPTVVGAAALLAGAFPNLTGRQIVQLLLTTADDAGAPGTDPIYGRGILNIGRAFQPQGQTSLAGKSAPISLLDNGSRSAAMGDAAPAPGARAIILDGYARAFSIDLTRTLRFAPQEQPLRQGLGGGDHHSSATAVGPVSLSLSTRRNAVGRPVDARGPTLGPEDRRETIAVAGTAVARLSSRTAFALGFSQSGRALQQQLAGDQGNAFLVARDPTSRAGFHPSTDASVAIRHDLGPVAVSATSERGEVYEPDRRHRPSQSGYRISTLVLDRRLGPARLSLGASRLSEEETLLGGRFAAAFSGAGADTTFLDGTASVDLGGGWGGYASYRRGWTSLRGTGAMISAGRLATEAFAFDLSRTGLFARGDRLAFRVMQPLRVARGGFDLNMPVAYDYDTGQARYETRFFNLAPTGRERDYEIAYGAALLGGYLDLNAFLRTDPGHVEAARPDRGAAIRITLRR
jgi:hypothetical protein